MVMGDEDDGLVEQPNWLQQRLKARLLGVNPYFIDSLNIARLELGIPEGGWTEKDDVLDWLYHHIHRLKPYYFPSEDGFGLTSRDRVLREMGRLGEHWLWREIESFHPNAEVEHLPLLLQVDRLREGFDLPTSIFPELVWHTVTGEPIPSTSTDTICIEEATPPEGRLDELGEPQYDQLELAIYDHRRSGLPDTPGDIVVIKLLVNEYTTKRELNEAWECINRVQGRRLQGRPRPRRRRAGPKVEHEQIPEWIGWHSAWKGGDTQETIAEIFDKTVEGIRYGIHQLEELMQPRFRNR